MARASAYTYETMAVESVDDHGVASVALNRPRKLNAFNHRLWHDLRACFRQLDADPHVRVVLLHQGQSRIFTAGLDISPGAQGDSPLLSSDGDDDPGRKAAAMFESIKLPQESISAVEQCRKPVVVVVDGGCIGAGVDLISACDIRYCTAKTYFSVKEVAVGLAADVGTLQRLPKIVGNDSIVRELALTARNMDANEAIRLGLVSSVHANFKAAHAHAHSVARAIAAHSPLAIIGTKMSLNYSRDHSVQEGLDHVRLMNAAFLQSPDLAAAMIAMLKKKPVSFAKL